MLDEHEHARDVIDQPGVMAAPGNDRNLAGGSRRESTGMVIC